MHDVWRAHPLVADERRPKGNGSRKGRWAASPAQCKNGGPPRQTRKTGKTVSKQVEVAQVPPNEDPVKSACAAGQCNTATERGRQVITTP